MRPARRTATRRLATITASVLAAGLALTGCVGSGGADQKSGGSSTLVVDTSFSLKTADPARMFEPTGIILLHGVYDSLLAFEGGDSKTPKPSIAKSFSANGDATVFTFPLRDDVTFSDGSKLTSADVVYSLNRVKNVKGNGSFLMDGLTVTAPDETTVVITSEKPNTAVPAIVTSPTLGIVNSTVVSSKGGSDAEGADTADTAEKYLNTDSAGSGPYVIDKYDASTEVTLKRNTKYWGTRPAYDTVVLRNADASTQLADIQSGTAQIALDLGSDQTAALKGNGDVTIARSASPTILFLFSNANPTVSRVTASQDFRDAVRFGLDYDGLLNLAGQGAERTPGVVPTSFLGALKASDATKQDLSAARAAVGRLGDVGEVSLSYPSDLSTNGLEFGPFAERIQADLAKIGLKVTLAPAPTTTALDSYRAGTEQMGFWLWSPDYPDPADYTVFTPGQTVGLRAGWAAGADPELEQVVTQVSTETDDAARAALFEKMQTLINQAGVFVPIVEPAATVVAATSVGKVGYDPVYGFDLTGLRG